jgi:hypothetical protein
VRNQHLADISSGRLIEILKDDEGRKHFAFSAAGCLFLVTTTFASAQRAVSYADLPDSLVVMTAADSQRQTQLQQEIPQKNGDTKPSNAGTPGGQPVPASKRQPKRILGLMPNYRAVSAGEIPPPPTPKEAFKIATDNSFDYSSFVFVGLTSIIAEGNDSHPQLGKGVTGIPGVFVAGFLGEDGWQLLGYLRAADLVSRG